MSGISRWLYAPLGRTPLRNVGAFWEPRRFLFDPAARGWAAMLPLLARSSLTLLSNFLCWYAWWSYGRRKRD